MSRVDQFKLDFEDWAYRMQLMGEDSEAGIEEIRAQIRGGLERPGKAVLLDVARGTGGHAYAVIAGACIMGVWKTSGKQPRRQRNERNSVGGRKKIDGEWVSFVVEDKGQMLVFARWGDPITLDASLSGIRKYARVEE